MRHVVALALWIAVPAVGAATAYAQRAGSPYGSGGKEPNNDDAVVESFSVRGLVVLVIIALAITVLVTRQRRRRQARVDRIRRVAAAAREAARDDPAFAPAAVKAAAAALFTDLQRAWSARDDEALERRLGPELLAGWRRSLKRLERRGQRSERLIVDGPQVSYIGLVNREGTEEDRATVALEAIVHQIVREQADDGALVSDAHVQVNAYWTSSRTMSRSNACSVCAAVDIRRGFPGATGLPAPGPPVSAGLTATSSVREDCNHHVRDFDRCAEPCGVGAAPE